MQQHNKMYCGEVGSGLLVGVGLCGCGGHAHNNPNQHNLPPPQELIVSLDPALFSPLAAAGGAWPTWRLATRVSGWEGQGLSCQHLVDSSAASSSPWLHNAGTPRSNLSPLHDLPLPALPRSAPTSLCSTHCLPRRIPRLPPRGGLCHP